MSNAWACMLVKAILHGRARQTHDRARQTHARVFFILCYLIFAKEEYFGCSVILIREDFWGLKKNPSASKIYYKYISKKKIGHEVIWRNLERGTDWRIKDPIAKLRGFYYFLNFVLLLMNSLVEFYLLLFFIIMLA